MRRLASAPNLAIATVWADVLRQAGIAASVQRAYLSGGAGELPPDQCWPEVWVEDDDQLEAARLTLDRLARAPSRRWVCPACDEDVDGPFDRCWNCGGPMPLSAWG